MKGSKDLDYNLISTKTWVKKLALVVGAQSLMTLAKNA